jgi:hypothetical protein
MWCLILIVLTKSSATMAESALVSPSKTPDKNPFIALRACWKECTKEERESFDLEPWKESFVAYLTRICVSGPCSDLQNPTRRSPCCCLEALDLVDEEVDQLFEYLLQYFKLDFTDQRKLILEWKQYAASFRIDELLHTTKYSKHQTFLLPGSSTHRICKSALAKLVGKSRHAWTSISENKSPVHGLSLRKQSNHAGNRALPLPLQEKLDSSVLMVCQYLQSCEATQMLLNYQHVTARGPFIGPFSCHKDGRYSMTTKVDRSPLLEPIQ